MKRLWYALHLILATLMLSACANAQIDNQQKLTNLDSEKTENVVDTHKLQETEEREEAEVFFANNKSSKILVAYFLWAENAVQDDIDAMTSASVKVGNVVQLADWIAEETGGDKFSIQLYS